MKKNWLIGGVVALVLLVVAGGAYLAFGDDDDGEDAVAAQEDSDAAKCLPEAPDCEPGGDDIADTCLEGTEDCDDTVDNGGSLGICAPGVTECDDMVVDDGSGDDVSQICLEGATDCNDTPATGEGGEDPARITEIVFADLESRIDSTAGEITLASLEAADWPDSCLGAAAPDEVCAQVITPGYKIVLEQLGTQYEYHTDASGGAFRLID